MKIDKHEEVLKEVLDEIGSSLRDRDGILAHQRRLAFILSMGSINLLELYFHKEGIMKEGSKINHQWFKKKAETVFEKLQNQVTSPIKDIQNIDEIVKTVIKIEEKRDELAYGPPAGEKILKEKIELFLRLRGLLKC